MNSLCVNVEGEIVCMARFACDGPDDYKNADDRLLHKNIRNLIKPECLQEPCRHIHMEKITKVHKSWKPTATNKVISEETTFNTLLAIEARKISLGEN